MVIDNTWTHPVNLGALPADAISQEIERAHEMIDRCTGQPPRGFIAPAWSSGRPVVSKLIDLGYLYDTSVFPSLWQYAVLAKIALNHLRNQERLRRVLHRRDWLVPMFGPRTPAWVNRDLKPASDGDDGIVVLPLPTRSRFLLPLWHTVGFVFGWTRAHKQIRIMLQRLEYFYYLLHPADLVGCEDMQDIDERYSHCLERMNAPLRSKLAAFQSVLELIHGSGRQVVTVEEMARRFLSNGKRRAHGTVDACGPQPVVS